MSSNSGCNRSGHSTRPSTDPTPENGYAFLAVLGIVAVLSVIAVGLSQRAHIGASVATFFLEETRDFYAAEVGITAATRALYAQPEFDQEGHFHLEITVDTRHLDILISEEARKKDVNRASLAEVAEAFMLLGVNASSAEMLSHRVIDWRDADDQSHPRGAEAADYLAAGSLVIPRNDSFVSLDEVETVLDPSSEIAIRLHEKLTLVPSANGGAIRSATSIGQHSDSSSNAAMQSGSVPMVDGITRSADATAEFKVVGLWIRLKHATGERKWEYFRLRDAGI